MLRPPSAQVGSAYALCPTDLSLIGEHHFKSQRLAALPAWSGTPAFLAPEVAGGEVDSFDGMAVDVWALGVTLFNWLTGKLPFWTDSGSEPELYALIAGRTWELPADREPALSDGAVDVLCLMLEKNPLARITTPGLRRHRWIT